jgi:tetratricopeptide (TPR) repeat protein
MRVSRIVQRFTLVLFVLVVLCAAAAEKRGLSGIVRDGAGKPLSGARITLTSRQIPLSTNQTTSGPSGEYRFAGLAAGEYTVAAELSGYAAGAPTVVHIQPASAQVTADLIITRAFSVLDSPSHPASSHPALEFQSAGIRGLIDPGGYSASTAGAASGLLRGIADLKRTDKSFAMSAVKAWPCGLEPELRKALAEHSDQAEANRRLGQFYVAHNQPGKAIPLLKRALEIDAYDDAASRELAVAWLESGEFEPARTLLTSLAAHLGTPEVHQLLARAEEGSGMFQQAAQQYRIAESEEPSEESLFGVGYELILAGSVADGVAAFQAGVERYPRSIPLCIGAGTAQFLLGKTSEGAGSFLDATDIDPSDPRAYPFLASAAGISGDERERARNSFKRYLDRKPDSAAANYFYALMLLRENAAADEARIETLLKRVIRLDPNLAKAHLQLADLYAQRTDDESAVPEYEAAVRLAQDLGEAHYRLAMAYKRTGRVDQSAREMQIFRLSKQRQAAGAEGIDLAQFISVMDAPDSHSNQETQCSAVPR